jgi:hypothetical protein
MSLWIELHCDAQRSKRPVLRAGTREVIKGHFEPCETNANDSPGAMFDPSNLSRAYGHLQKDARARGWKKTKAGWVCPNCQDIWQSKRP